MEAMHQEAIQRAPCLVDAAGSSKKLYMGCSALRDQQGCQKCEALLRTVGIQQSGA